MGGPFSFRYMTNTNILLQFYPPSKSEQFVLLLYLKSDSFRLFNKNKDIDLYIIQKHFESYTEIYGSFCVNNCQIEFENKEKVLPSVVVLILYGAS